MWKKLYTILSPQAKGQLPYLLGLFIVGGMIELLSIISILPFMALASQPQKALGHPTLAAAYRMGGFESTQSFVAFAGFATILCLALGNGAVVVTNYLGLRFLAGEHARLATRLMERYFGSEYSWFAGQNSADLSFRVLSEVPTVVNGIMLSLLRAIAKVVVISLIVLSLLWIQPVVAVSTATVLIGLQLAVYRLLRPILSRLSDSRIQADRRRNRIVRESLAGIKAVLLFEKSRFFQRLFCQNTVTSTQSFSKQAALSELPRGLLETLAFGSVVLFLMVLILNDVSITEFLPTMSLFVVAAYRLLPAIQQVFTYATTVRMYVPSLEHVYQDLESASPAAVAEPEGGPPHPFKQSLGLSKAVFTYPGSDHPVLHDVTVVIQRDSTVGLVGKTGCGKSTMLDLLLGLLRPDSGELQVDGQPLAEEQRLAWRRNVGYVPQEIQLLDDTIAANIAFGESHDQIDRVALERAARIAHLDEFVMTLPGQFDSQVGDRGVRLSGGQRQRIGLARALYKDPPILILDEATSALDNVTEASVMAAIRELSGQKTILIVAHRLSTVRDCDRILVMDRGLIVGDGPFDALLEACPAFRELASVGKLEDENSGSTSSALG